MGNVFSCLWLGLALVLAISAANLPGEAADTVTSIAADYRGKGVVIELLPAPSRLHATRPVIVIRHEPILPLMPESMEMPFIAASPALFDHLQPGDHIAFALRTTSDALLVVAIDRLPR